MIFVASSWSLYVRLFMPGGQRLHPPRSYSITSVFYILPLLTWRSRKTKILLTELLQSAGNVLTSVTAGFEYQYKQSQCCNLHNYSSNDCTARKMTRLTNAFVFTQLGGVCVCVCVSVCVCVCTPVELRCKY